MKTIATLIASLFVVTAFAGEPAKKDEKKVVAKPAATTNATAKATDKSTEVKKTEATKK